MIQSICMFSNLAADPSLSKRKYEEEEHPVRDAFDRDRDRILYSREFRRLSGKTQVFVAGFDDDVRTRLTHTLEVAQISKTIAKCLGLNITLAEAISLGHDVGHTPFGHVGERVLNYILNGCERIKNFDQSLSERDKGFKHNWQSIRVVSDLETMRRGVSGINLTYYTLWGILQHSKLQYSACKLNHKGSCGIRHNETEVFQGCPAFSLGFYSKYEALIKEDAWTLEGYIVRLADEIAQRNHDLQDGIFAGIIDIHEIIDFIRDNFSRYLSATETEELVSFERESNKSILVMGLSRLIVNLLVSELLKSSQENLLKFSSAYSINNTAKFELLKPEIGNAVRENLVSYSPEFQPIENTFQQFLMNRIISSYTAQKMDGKADYIIRQLFKCFVSNPQQLPDSTILRIYKNLGEDIDTPFKNKSVATVIGDFRQRLKGDHSNTSNTEFNVALLRTVADYIAGMTDKYALQLFQELYEV